MLRKSIVLDDSVLRKLAHGDFISGELFSDDPISKDPQNYERFKTTLVSRKKAQEAFSEGCHILIQIFTPQEVYESCCKTVEVDDLISQLTCGQPVYIYIQYINYHVPAYFQFQQKRSRKQSRYSKEDIFSNIRKKFT
jgi:hypothetical protein